MSNMSQAPFNATALAIAESSQLTLDLTAKVQELEVENKLLRQLLREVQQLVQGWHNQELKESQRRLLEMEQKVASLESARPQSVAREMLPVEIKLARFREWISESEQEFNLPRMLAIDRSMPPIEQASIPRKTEGAFAAEFFELWFRFEALIRRQDLEIRSRFINV